MTPHSMDFPKIPCFHNSDINTAMLWAVARMICRVEELWKCICNIEFYTSKWHSWMQTYLAKFCFHDSSHCQATKDLFKIAYMLKIEKLYEKVKVYDFKDYFVDLNNVFFSENNEDIDVEKCLQKEEENDEDFISNIILIVGQTYLEASDLVQDLFYQVVTFNFKL